jgi:hypothetical protein
MPIFVADTTYSQGAINQNSGTYDTSVQLNGNLSVGTYMRSSGQPSFFATGTGASWLYSSNFGGTGYRELGSAMGWAVSQTGAGSYGFNTSTGRFTAPVTGHYYFYAQAYYYNDNNSNSGYIHWQFGRNGVESWNEGRTPLNIYSHGTIANHTDGIHVHAMMFLNVGDYCSIRPFWGGTVGRFYTDYFLFTGSYLGPY